MKHRRTLSTIALLTCLSSASGNHYSFRTVVKSGDPVPEVGGTFTSFGVPRINSSGQVAFAASRTGELATTGMWLTAPNAPETLERIMLSNIQPPDAPPSATFGHLTFLAQSIELNDAGNVGISVPLLGIEGNSPNGLFRYVGGTLSKVAITGDPAPGIGGGVTFRKLSEWPGFNQGNLMAFGAVLQGPGVTAANDVTVYMHWFGGLNLVKRENSSAPPDGFGWTWGGNAPPNYPQFLGLVQIANDGRLGFDSELHTAEGSRMTRWTGWPGLLSLGTMAGNLSPTFHPFANNQENLGIFSTALTENGFTFTQGIEVNGETKSGIWQRSGSDTLMIAYEGGAGPIGTYQHIWPYSVIGAYDGSVLFPAVYDLPDPSAKQTIMMHRPGVGTYVLAQSGNPAPGYGPGVTFQWGFTANALDDQGRAYFTSHVTGPGIDITNNQALYRADSDASLSPVIRKGQWLVLDDGIARQVEDFAVHRGAGLRTGNRPGVNNDGDVALRVNFTDSSYAVIVAEPNSCPADLNNDGVVDFTDLLMLLSSWGTCPGCAADLDHSGHVEFIDLLSLLNAWGNCP